MRENQIIEICYKEVVNMQSVKYVGMRLAAIRIEICICKWDVEEYVKHASAHTTRTKSATRASSVIIIIENTQKASLS